MVSDSDSDTAHSPNPRHRRCSWSEVVQGQQSVDTADKGNYDQPPPARGADRVNTQSRREGHGGRPTSVAESLPFDRNKIYAGQEVLDYLNKTNAALEDSTWRTVRSRKTDEVRESSDWVSFGDQKAMGLAGQKGRNGNCLLDMRRRQLL